MRLPHGGRGRAQRLQRHPHQGAQPSGAQELGAAEDLLSFYKGDIGDEKFIQSLFERGRPHGVCHLAAWAGVRASLKDTRVYAHSNVVGTSTLPEMAQPFGCRSVAMASSNNVYGDRQKAGGA